MIKLIYQMNQEILEQEKIVIYGAGTSGERLLSELLYDNVSVDYFCDSDPKKWGTYVMKKKVISIEELAEMKEHCAVLISSVYCEEIMELLEKSGISNIFVTHKDVFGQPKS